MGNGPAMLGEREKEGVAGPLNGGQRTWSTGGVKNRLVDRRKKKKKEKRKVGKGSYLLEERKEKHDHQERG